jgi:Spy/CpxP family protein refolding chaperone
MIERLGLSPDQRKRIETIRQEHRLKQIDLRAAAEKARVTLEPLVGADQPDEGKILSQMDRVAQAESELRKDEMRQQLEIRKVLTPDQWRRVQEERRNPAPQIQPGPGGRQGKGPGQGKGPQGPPPQN